MEANEKKKMFKDYLKGKSISYLEDKYNSDHRSIKKLIADQNCIYPPGMK